MKKFAVILIAILAAMAVLAFGGIFDKLLSTFEKATAPVIEPARGVYYLYSESFEGETEEAGYVRLDYLKNSQVTYCDFGDVVSIQTPNEHYLVGSDGKVSIGEDDTGVTVDLKKISDKYYIDIESLSKLKGFEDFGVTAHGSGDYTYYVNENFSYKKGVLAAETPVFASEDDFDAYIASRNRGGRLLMNPRGVTEKTTEGYYYTINSEGMDYTYFFSDDARLTGFVEMDALGQKTKTEEKPQVSYAKLKNVMLVWEAVYTDMVDTAEIGEMSGLNVVSPTWYTLESKDGAYGSLADAEYINWARKRDYNLWPLISNHSDIELTNEFLASYRGQEAFIRGLIDEAVRHGYDGYNLDFEYIYLSDRDAYSHFVNRFSYEMRKWGLATSVDVNVMDGADNWSKCYDHEVLGAVTELLVIMAYDEHHASSETAGSVSSFNWVNYNLGKIAEVVNPEKIVLGIPFYTRVWETNAGGISSEVLSMKNTDDYLGTLPFEVVWDDNAKQHKAAYSDGTTLLEIWVEDASSLENKVGLVSEYGLAGVAAWRRGFESDDVWEVIKQGELEIERAGGSE